MDMCWSYRPYVWYGLAIPLAARSLSSPGGGRSRADAAVTKRPSRSAATPQERAALKDFMVPLVKIAFILAMSSNCIDYSTLAQSWGSPQKADSGGNHVMFYCRCTQPAERESIYSMSTRPGRLGGSWRRDAGPHSARSFISRTVREGKCGQRPSTWTGLRSDYARSVTSFQHGFCPVATRPAGGRADDPWLPAA